jgi:hypothetical protein
VHSAGILLDIAAQSLLSAGTYCAPGWWWQNALAKPIKVGRPRKNEP